jgi:hypothetical protein
MKNLQTGCVDWPYNHILQDPVGFKAGCQVPIIVGAPFYPFKVTDIFVQNNSRGSEW